MLRAVETKDLPALFAQQADAQACEMAVVHPRDAAAFDLHWARILGDPSSIARAIIADGELAGQISCYSLDGQRLVGYWIAREHWGRGIATRALRLLVREVAARPLHARVAVSNGASIRVLERCGFVVTGRRHAPADDRYPACEEALLVMA